MGRTNTCEVQGKERETGSNIEREVAAGKGEDFLSSEGRRPRLVEEGRNKRGLAQCAGSGGK